MQISHVVISVTVCSFLCAALAAQTEGVPPKAAPATSEVPGAPAGVTTAQPAAPAAAPAPPVLPSNLLVPSLNHLQETLNALKLDKWKRGTVRDEAGDNVNEVLKDVKSTLPDLMKTADSGPEAVSKTLPLSRNLGALYDVMLRVYEASRVVAPVGNSAGSRRSEDRAPGARRPSSTVSRRGGKAGKRFAGNGAEAGARDARGCARANAACLRSACAQACGQAEAEAQAGGPCYQTSGDRRACLDYSCARYDG